MIKHNVVSLFVFRLVFSLFLLFQPSLLITLFSLFLVFLLFFLLYFLYSLINLSFLKESDGGAFAETIIEKLYIENLLAVLSDEERDFFLLLHIIAIIKTQKHILRNILCHILISNSIVTIVENFVVLFLNIHRYLLHPPLSSLLHYV